MFEKMLVEIEILLLRIRQFLWCVFHYEKKKH